MDVSENSGTPKTPQNVGKPMVVGYHYFRKPSYKFLNLLFVRAYFGDTSQAADSPASRKPPSDNWPVELQPRGNISPYDVDASEMPTRKPTKNTNM